MSSTPAPRVFLPDAREPDFLRSYVSPRQEKAVIVALVVGYMILYIAGFFFGLLPGNE